MAETRELLRRVWNTQQYTDFAISVQGDEFVITDDDLCFLKKLELLFYQENRLNADNQRDLAQSLSLLIDRVKYEKLKGENCDYSIV
jgi:hypothetical protein